MRVSFFYIVLMICSQQFVAAHMASGQGLDKQVTIGAENETLSVLFQKLKGQTGLSFAFPQLDEYPGVTFKVGNRTVREVLDIALEGKNLQYALKGRTVVIFDEMDENKNGSVEEIQLTSASGEVEGLAVITGTVTDASTQEPMAGVNVIVKSTTKGTTTDVEGKFSIDAEDGDLLVFSFIGFKSYETKAIGRQVIDVTMEGDIASLDEIVVKAGYWDLKKSENTGNISKVEAKDIQKQPVSNPLAALQGRVPGLEVTQDTGIPGGNFQVRIRGRNSIESGNEPFYIIDGVPFISGPLSSPITSASILGNSGASPFNTINPSEIESIEVLKDADATSIYGSRGANGVILITTKRGKPGKTKVDVNVFTGLSKVAHKIDMMNSKQYVEMRREAIRNDGAEAYIPIIPFFFYDIATWDTTRYTDWQEELIGGVARTSNLQASISGGTSNTQFSLSIGYNKQGTVFPGNFSYDRWSSNFSINHQSPNQRFKVNFSGNYGADSNDQARNDLTVQSLLLPPTAPSLYNLSKKINFESGTFDNPLAYLNQKFQSNSNSFVGNAVLSYDLVAGLQVKSNFGFNELKMKDIATYPSTFYDPALGITPASASCRYNNSIQHAWIIEPQINWQRDIYGGRITALAGATFQNQEIEQTTQQGVGFTSDDLMEDISAASQVSIFDFNKSQYRYNAFFGRVNYSWRDKYILNLTGRRDGSSRFGPGKQFANFGAIGAAWSFSNEGFIKRLFPALSFGKFRTSYGTSGNDQIGEYAFLDTYTTTSVYQGINGLGPTRLFNSDFAWEVNKKFEIGLEIGLIRDRIFFSASFYKNRSSNQLINYTLPGTTGFTSIRQNWQAIVENRGVELELNTVNIQRHDFKWVTSLNITIPRNKLIEFPGLENSTYRTSYIIGESLNIKKRYNYTGLNPQTGIYTFSDMNNDGAITLEDRTVIKEIGKKFYGGANNSLSYKGWRLDIFLQFVSQTTENYFAIIANMAGSGYSNMPSDIFAERWRESGDIGTVQQFSIGFNSSVAEAFSFYRESNKTIVDASFIRLKNVALSYEFPLKWTAGVSTRLYFQGQNLFTITNYQGLDPENANPMTLPPLRTLILGIQATF